MSPIRLSSLLFFVDTMVVSVVLAGSGCTGTLCGGDGNVEGNVELLDDGNVQSLAGCTSITGDLLIAAGPGLLPGSSGPGPTSLIGLETLTSVSGAVAVREPATLTNLDGLSGLSFIGGDLLLLGSALTNLDGLVALTSVHDIHVIGNHALASIDGLGAITSIEGDIAVEGNDALTDLDAFSNLQSVTGGLLIGCSLFCPGANNMTDIVGLSSLRSVGGNMTLAGIPGLQSLEGLSALSSVGGFLAIGDSIAGIGVKNVDALSALSSVGGLNIANNALLEDLDGLSALTSVGEIVVIENNAALAPCVVDAFAARFQGVQCQCSGNTGEGTCD